MMTKWRKTSVNQRPVLRRLNRSTYNWRLANWHELHSSWSSVPQRNCGVHRGGEFFFGGCPSPLTSIENCTTQSYLQGGSNDVACPQLMVCLIFVEVCVVLSQLLHNVTKMMPWPCHCKHQFSECRVWDKVPERGTFIFGDTHILL